MLGRKVAEGRGQRRRYICYRRKGFGELETVEGTLVAENTGQDLSVQHVIPIYPRPLLSWGQNGGVYVRDISPDGEVDEHVIYHHDVYVTQR